MPRRLATTSGGEVSYLDAGSGRPVVLLHGFPLSSHLWRHVIPALAVRMRVVAPDLPGCGASVPAPGARLDLRSQARYVRELLDALDVGSFAVVGHGAGGAVAQLMAAPPEPSTIVAEAARGGVDAMVLIDSATADSWPPRRLADLLDEALRSRSPSSAAGAVAAALELGLGSGRAPSAEDVREYWRPFEGSAGAVAFERGAAALDASALAGIGPSLAALEAPALLLWGEDDPLVPPEAAERLQEGMPSAALALLPGVGHVPPEEAPDTVASLVGEWLRARYLREGHQHAPAGPVVVSVGRRPPPEAEFTGESFDGEDD
jgi:pimeloyl-ACP methyl ester carboxylesterase